MSLHVSSSHHARDVSAGAVTVAGNTGQFPNLCSGERATVVVDVNVTALTGAGASLTPQLDASPDGGTTWFKVAAMTAITAVGQSRMVVNDVLEATVRVSWPLPAGTTPSITCNIDLCF